MQARLNKQYIEAVNDDGSMGQAIDLDDMQGVLAQLATTRPVNLAS